MSASRKGPRALGRIGAITAAACAVAAFVAVPAASAAPTTVYNNVPSPLPGNEPSVGFEATSASEFGGQLQFDGTARHNPRVTVGFSSWGCQSGTWNAGNCSTTPGSTFAEPIQIRVYDVAAGDEPGAMLGSVTHTVNIPYRPSANYTHCNADNGKSGEWFSKRDSSCYNGKLVKRTFALGGLDMPDKAIVSVAYNTTHFGYNPIGESASCFGTTGGCGYDALNVATSPDAPSVGSQPLPDDAYQNSSWAGAYCDGGAGGTGSFRLDAGCWTGFQPMLKVSAR